MEVAQGKVCAFGSLDSSSPPGSLFASTEGSSCDEDTSKSDVDVLEPARDVEVEKRKPRWRLCLDALFLPPPATSAEFIILGSKDRAHHVGVAVTDRVGDLTQRVLMQDGLDRLAAACSPARLRTADGRLLPTEARIRDVVGCGELKLLHRKSAMAATRCGCSVRRTCGRCEALCAERGPARVSFDQSSDMPKAARLFDQLVLGVPAVPRRSRLSSVSQEQ